ncbi:hypothetical protein BDQ17DRAFT_648502 [Cyathus striatus]|nr:hypothetical protein BDQ17DRAFT_648502 [Cyathus striatus]
MQNILHNDDIIKSMYYNDIFNVLADILKKNYKYQMEEEYRLKVIQKYMEKHVGLQSTFNDSLLCMENKYLNTEQQVYEAIFPSVEEILFKLQVITVTYWNQGKILDALHVENKILNMFRRMVGDQNPNTL